MGRRRRGFTLVELMVVIVILGILATAVTLKVMGALREARVNRAKEDLSKVVQALETYRAKKGEYPEDLSALTEPLDENYTEGLLSGIPKDPWGNEYYYEREEEGKGYMLLSYGPNGEYDEGAEEGDDIDAKDLTGRREDEEQEK